MWHGHVISPTWLNLHGHVVNRGHVVHSQSPTRKSTSQTVTGTARHRNARYGSSQYPPTTRTITARSRQHRRHRPVQLSSIGYHQPMATSARRPQEAPHPQSVRPAAAARHRPPRWHGPQERREDPPSRAPPGRGRLTASTTQYHAVSRRLGRPGGPAVDDHRRPASRRWDHQVVPNPQVTNTGDQHLTDETRRSRRRGSQAT